MICSRDRIVNPRAALFLVLLCAWVSSQAFTYRMMKDGDLLDQAPLVVVARVMGDGYAVPGDNAHTYYRIEVSSTLKGAQSAVLQVRVAGSPPGADPFWLVAGAPHFVAGERALLFLGAERNGVHGIQQFALGAFHIVRQGARDFALRDLGGGRTVGPGSVLDPPRLLAPFSRWLQARAAGDLRAADYFPDPRTTQDLPHPAFTQFTDSATGNRVRWRAFDSSTTVNWVRNGGDAYVTQTNQALATWQNDPASTILLSLTGTTTLTDGLTNFDSTNTFLFGDPNQEIPGAFTCSSGGTLAMGGPWFQNGPTAPTHQFNGTTYQEIVGGDVVVQDGVACSFDAFGKAPAAEVLAHEIGHTLGLRHSCGSSDPAGPCDNSPVGDNNALMRANTHGGTHGATLGVDDQNGIAFIYGSGAGGNQAPTAAITVNCTNLSCNFSGAASNDPDGSITSYAWTFGDGQSANGVSVSHTYAGAGTFTVMLTVTDNQGAQGSLSGTVTVSSGNISPSVSFTVNCSMLTCTFDASASKDVDGSIVSYVWNFGEGAGATGVTATHTYTSNGTFTVTLTVTDNVGGTASLQQVVSVAIGNQLPVAQFVVSCSSLSCSFDASASNDPDGTLTSFRWNFGDSSTATLTTNATTHVFTQAGTFSIQLTVTDNAGATASNTKSLTVIDQSLAPMAAFTYTCTKTTCSFDASASTDPDGTIRKYAWIFGDQLFGLGATITHTYPSPGTYAATLIVTDNDGLQDSLIQDVFAGTPFPPGLSGLWFDPSLDGEGYNLISNPAGQIIFYYGNDATGKRLWLISDVLDRPFLLNDPVTFTLFRGNGGTFAQPAPSASALSVWGTLTVTFNDCLNGSVVLDGQDGNKTSLIQPLGGINGSNCFTPQAKTSMRSGTHAKVFTTGLSGLWFDPALEGEGFNLIETSSGTIIFFYGYDISGGRLWLLSDLLPDAIKFDTPLTLNLQQTLPGAFDTPNPALSQWGTMDLTFTDCTHGVFVLNGSAGVVKTSNIQLLAPIKQLGCVNP